MNLYIVGAGGFGSEVEWLVSELNKQRLGGDEFRVVFVNQYLDRPGNTESRYFCERQVIGGAEFSTLARNSKDKILSTVAVGNPQDRMRIQKELFDRKIEYPILIHPSVEYDKRKNRVDIGMGSVICLGASLTTRISIGNFVHINMNCTIGHEVKIGNFCTLSPGVHVNGGVIFEDLVFVGSGAVFHPRVTIGKGSKIGAGAVVSKDVPEGALIVPPSPLKIK